MATNWIWFFFECTLGISVAGGTVATVVSPTSRSLFTMEDQVKYRTYTLDHITMQSLFHPPPCETML